MDILAFLELLISSEIVILDRGCFPTFLRKKRETMDPYEVGGLSGAQSLWLWHSPPKAFLLGVSRKKAGCFQDGRLQGR